MRSSLPVALGGEYPSGYRLNHQGFIQTISPDLQMLPVSFSDTFPQFRNLYRQRICLYQFRVFSLSSSLFLLRIGLNENWRFQEDLCIRVNAYDIALLPIVQTLTKLRYVSIPTVCHSRPMGHSVRSGLINQIQGYPPLLPVMDLRRHKLLANPVTEDYDIRVES